MRIRSLFILILTTLAGCGAKTPRHGLPMAAAETIGLSAGALAQITPVLQGYVDSGKVAGIVAVVVRHGRIGYLQSVGVMDLEQGTPMRSDAVFRIYSMTKPIVAAGVLKLVEQGKVALDDPVAKYIPAFANVKVYVSGPAVAPMLREPETAVTVRHLLTHTAGIGYGVQETAVDTLFRRAALFDPMMPLANFADSITTVPLLFSPGSKWSYSAAIDVAGRVIEVASGLPLDRFLQSELFAPLGMRDTGFRLRDATRRRLPVLYMRGDDGRLQESTGPLTQMYEPHARFFWGGGGLLSTPADYLRFAQMLLNGGELDGKRVLSAASVNEMTRNQLPAHLTPIPSTFDSGYGQGLGGTVLVDSTASKLPGSAGIYRWSGYVGTYFWIDPQADLVALVWTQFSPGRAYPLEQEFQRLVYGALRR